MTGLAVSSPATFAASCILCMQGSNEDPRERKNEIVSSVVSGLSWQLLGSFSFLFATEWCAFAVDNEEMQLTLQANCGVPTESFIRKGKGRVCCWESKLAFEGSEPSLPPHK